MADEMTEVEYQELVAHAALIGAPLGAFFTADPGRVGPNPRNLPPPPPVTADPPSGFDFVVNDALYMLGSNAQDLTDHLLYGVQQWQHLADSLRNAAKAYQKTDEGAADAITTGGEQQAEPTPAADSPGGRLGSTHYQPKQKPANQNSVDKSVADNCLLLRGKQQSRAMAVQTSGQEETTALANFADEWQKYQRLLLEARSRFLPFQSWSGPTRDMVEKNFRDQIAWCEAMAANCVQLANQARTIVKAHKDAVRDHPTLGARDYTWSKDNHAPDVGQETDLQVLDDRFQIYYCTGGTETGPFTKNICGSEGWHRDSGCHFSGADSCDYVDKPDDLNGYRNFEKRYQNIQKASDDAVTAYRNAVSNMPPITSPMPPTATPIDPPKPAPPKPPDPVNPVNPYPNRPFIPQMPQIPQMPMTPPDPDEAAEAAGLGAPGRLTGAGSGIKPGSLGGVKPAAFGGGGGGVPKAPLAPAAMDAEAAASRVAGAGPGAAAAGRGVPAGAMGGMPGGMPMAPGAGKGDNDGKGKRVQGEEDALYVEDRAWTEGVIGRRRAKDSTDK